MSSAVPPPISLIIGTHDRASQLRDLLERLPVRSITDLGAELIIVDNGSRDATADVLRAYAERATHRFLAVSEPARGGSNARNSGIAAATAPLLAFTDDDCYVNDDFLHVAVDAFGDETIHYAGGRVVLHDDTDDPISCNDRRRREHIAPNTYLPAGFVIGANMVFRREVLDALGGFDPMFGAGTEFRCEDIDLVARASMAGYTGVFLPELLIRHHHRRKPGPDIVALRRADDHGRGAYFAKSIMAGHRRYAARWLWHAARPWHLGRTARELRGAAAYRRAASTRQGVSQ